jgi:hypothetical protein
MQLTYRGTTYTFQAAPLSLPKAAFAVTRELVYRGCSYRCELPIGQSEQPAQAMNWRFSSPVKSQDQALNPAHA